MSKNVCERLSDEFVKVNELNKGRNLQVNTASPGACMDGGWGQVPTGCSMQTGYDNAPHFKGEEGSVIQKKNCVSDMFQLICTGEKGL